MRVLVVEDEGRLAANVARALREGAGYAVDIAHDGRAGPLHGGIGRLTICCYWTLMLPKLDGTLHFRVSPKLTRYRKQDRATPVLVLTARDEKEWVVKMLNAGADDYVAKPFDLGELLARAKALVRRGKGQRSPVISVADLQLDTITRTVHRGQREIALTPMEYRVLEYLGHRPRAVVSKAELLEHLYDYNWEKFSNVIEVYISGLRRKIDDRQPIKLIHTMRGHGYVLRAERERRVEETDFLAHRTANHGRGGVPAAADRRTDTRRGWCMLARNCAPHSTRLYRDAPQAFWRWCDTTRAILQVCCSISVTAGSVVKQLRRIAGPLRRFADWTGAWWRNRTAP